MRAVFKVIAGPDQDRSFIFPEGKKLVIGRGKLSDTRLRDPEVSRIHCLVQAENDRFVLQDFDSPAGVLVNGVAVKRHELKPGDVIQIGNTQLCFQLEAGADEPTWVRGRSPTAPSKPVKIAPDRKTAVKVKKVRDQAAEQAAPEKIANLTELAGKGLSHFAIESVLAKGRTGVVFRARDTRDDALVALKVLLPVLTGNEAEMTRFVRAMKTVIPLRHPNLVAVFAAGRKGPYAWIAMELVEGDSVSQLIGRLGVGGRLDWVVALRTAVHVARALEFAHGHNILHRNITPQNILIDHQQKKAMLGDLMLAKALEGALAQPLTRPGELLGDISYMPPERTRASAAADARSDIYGLGATLYALLTGRPPFAAGTLDELINRIRQVEPERPKRHQLAIPDLLDGLVLKMLAKRPEDRFGSASELLVDLQRIVKVHAAGELI